MRAKSDRPQKWRSFRQAVKLPVLPPALRAAGQCGFDGESHVTTSCIRRRNPLFLECPLLALNGHR